MKLIAIIIPIFVLYTTSIIRRIYQQSDYFLQDGQNLTQEYAIDFEKQKEMKIKLGYFVHRNESFQIDTINKVFDYIQFDKKLRDSYFQSFDSNKKVHDFIEKTFDTAMENKILARSLSRINGSILSNWNTLYNVGSCSGAKTLQNKGDAIKNLWHFGYALDTLTKMFFNDFLCSDNACFNTSDASMWKQIHHIFDKHDFLKRIPSCSGKIFQISRNTKIRLTFKCLSESFENRIKELHCLQTGEECIGKSQGHSNMKKTITQNIMWAAAGDFFLNFPKIENLYAGTVLISLLDLANQTSNGHGWMEHFEESLRKKWLDLYTAWDIMFCINLELPYLNLECVMKLLIPEQGGYHGHYNSGWYLERRAYSLSLFLIGFVGNGEDRIIPAVHISEEFIAIFQEEINYAVREVREKLSKTGCWSCIMTNIIDIFHLHAIEFLEI